MSRYIPVNVERKLLSESLGRCMNPSCNKQLFFGEGDIIERAHIVEHCQTSDNSFENLIILCPNCHTNFDKNKLFTKEEVFSWKEQRQRDIDCYFGVKFNTFAELSNVVSPLLLENRIIFESYYLEEKKDLWDEFEYKILENNKKIEKILSNNISLFQKSNNKTYSNKYYIMMLLQHIKEFENTRGTKFRSVLFPDEINSIFGIEKVKDKVILYVNNLEKLISKLKDKSMFVSLSFGVDSPFIELIEGKKKVKVYLNDSPRIRQLYHDYECFSGTDKVNLDNLNFVYKYIKQHIPNFIIDDNNLSKPIIKNMKFVFVYEYCISEVFIRELAPGYNNVIVNLHGWNGINSISKQAYEIGKKMGVKLLCMDHFYGYIYELGNK